MTSPCRIVAQLHIRPPKSQHASNPKPPFTKLTIQSKTINKYEATLKKKKKNGPLSHFYLICFLKKDELVAIRCAYGAEHGEAVGASAGRLLSPRASPRNAQTRRPISLFFTSISRISLGLLLEQQ